MSEAATPPQRKVLTTPMFLNVQLGEGEGVPTIGTEVVFERRVVGKVTAVAYDAFTVTLFDGEDDLIRRVWSHDGHLRVFASVGYTV